MKQLAVNIKVLSPIVLSSDTNTTVMTESLNYFSGTVLRGILAERYIACQKLGNEAHKDLNFIKLFFKDLRFIDANPVHEKIGRRSFVLPLSIQKAKSGTNKTTEIQDLMKEMKPKLGYKSFRGYAVAVDDILHPISVNKNIKLHMSRISDNERLLGRSQDGNIYNYESINERQQFQGIIIGEEKNIYDLLKSLNLQNNKFITYAGRSKYTQYGKCQLSFQNIADIEQATESDINEDNAICLRLETHYIPICGLYRNVNEQLQEILNFMNADIAGNFQISDIYASHTEIGNFVGIWKMRRPREQALSAGTVFKLKKNTKWTKLDFEHLTELIYNGCGMRIEEGFGQLRIWPLKDYKIAANDNYDVKQENANIPIDVKILVQKIIKEKIIDQLRIYGVEDANSLKNIIKLTHFFTELNNMLQQAKIESMSQIRETMKSIIQNSPQNKKGRPFNDHLTTVNLYDDISLEDIFINKLIIPYKNRNWRKDIGSEDSLIKLSEQIDLDLATLDIGEGKYFYEYWNSFLHTARKKSAINKEVS